jgi:hypothetical protein
MTKLYIINDAIKGILTFVDQDVDYILYDAHGHHESVHPWVLVTIDGARYIATDTVMIEIGNNGSLATGIGVRYTEKCRDITSF